MREILFRGKRMYDGEWVYGFYNHRDYAFIAEPDKLIRRHYILPLNAQDAFVVLPETVGQYTGLKDRNGKRIFEGDIADHHVQADILVSRGVIFWDARNARWAQRLKTMEPALVFFNPEAWEIIGNIHDNPELLEVQKND